MCTNARMASYCNAILRGRSYELHGDWREASHEYQQAVEFFPDWSLAHRALARMCRYLEDVGSATHHARRAFEIDFERSIDQLLRAGLDSRLLMVSAGKLRHDLEQLEYLVEQDVLGGEVMDLYGGYRDVLDVMSSEDDTSKTYVLTEKVLRTLGESIYRPVHIHGPVDVKASPLSLANDFASLQERYLSERKVLIVDDLLTHEALASLRRFTLESTVWCDAKPRGYVGAYLDRGLSCELLYRIAFDLRRAMPKVFARHLLHEIWGYRYDSAKSGIGVHADAAVVNVNLWITQDDANLTPDRAGLVIYPVAPPSDWKFERYNSRKGREDILAFIRDSAAEPIRVPYRANRVVVFDSQYFHETDEFVFREGYANRRTNLTFLYGNAVHDPALWMSRAWASEILPVEVVG